MPFDFFSKTSIPEKVPESMLSLIDELKESSSKEECLKKVYNVLTHKYRGYRVKTFTRFPEVFMTDINRLWGKSGFLHCSNINYIARVLLIKSELFTEKDIQQKVSFIWYISLHQYLRVNVGERFINIDIWAHPYGTEYGNYAHGFK